MTTILRQIIQKESVWHLSSIGSPPKLIGRLLCSTWDSSHPSDRRRVEVQLGPSVDLPSSTQSQLGGPCRLGDALASAIAKAARPEYASERGNHCTVIFNPIFDIGPFLGFSLSYFQIKKSNSNSQTKLKNNENMKKFLASFLAHCLPVFSILK